MSIEVPDVRELSADEASPADSLVWLTHQRQIEGQRLAMLRDALLPELMSGRILVPEAQEAVGAAMT